MSVAFRKNIPVPREIGILTVLDPVTGIREVTGLGLAPDTDVRILGLDEIHEIVIIVSLVGPHSVLDVPVKDLQIAPRRRESQRRDDNRDDRDK